MSTVGKHTAHKAKAYRAASLDGLPPTPRTVEPAPPGSPFTTPLPAYAASIWATPRGLSIGLGPSEGATRGHTIFLDFDKLALPDGAQYVGWAVLRSLLQERARAAYRPSIATRAAPAQSNVDELLRAMARAPKVAKFDERGQAKTTLADLGLED